MPPSPPQQNAYLRLPDRPTNTPDIPPEQTRTTWGPCISSLAWLLDWSAYPHLLNYALIAYEFIHWSLLSPTAPWPNNNPNSVYSSVAPPPPSPLPPFTPGQIQKAEVLNEICSAENLPLLNLTAIGTTPPSFYDDKKMAQQVTAAIWAWCVTSGAIKIPIMLACFALSYRTTYNKNPNDDASIRTFFKKIKTFSSLIPIIYTLIAMRKAGDPFKDQLAKTERYLRDETKTDACTVNTYEALSPVILYSKIFAFVASTTCPEKLRSYFTDAAIGPYAAGAIAYLVSQTNTNFVLNGGLLTLILVLENIKPMNKRLNDIALWVKDKLAIGETPERALERPHQYALENESSDKGQPSSASLCYNIMLIGMLTILIICFAALPFNTTPPNEICSGWYVFASQTNCTGILQSPTDPSFRVELSSKRNASTPLPGCTATKQIDLVHENTTVSSTALDFPCSLDQEYRQPAKVIEKEVWNIYKAAFIGIPITLIAGMGCGLIQCCLNMKKMPQLNPINKFLSRCSILIELALDLQSRLLPATYLIILTMSVKQAMEIYTPQNASIPDALSYLLHILTSTISSMFQPSNEYLSEKNVLDIQASAQLFCWTKIIYIVTGFVPACTLLLALIDCCERPAEIDTSLPTSFPPIEHKKTGCCQKLSNFFKRQERRDSEESSDNLLAKR